MVRRPGRNSRSREYIIAVVLQNGMPRKQLTVASYVAPGPIKLARTRRITLKRITVKHHMAAVSASWKAVPGAARYEITLSTFHGRRRLSVIKGRPRTLTFPNIPVTDAATVTVQPVSANGRHRLGATKALKTRKR
jgi:hypothetical protein